MTVPDLHYNGTGEALPSKCLGREDPTVFLFSSWHCDFQVPHTSCLDAKNSNFHRDEQKQETMHSANIKGCLYTYLDIFNPKVGIKCYLLR